MITTEVRCSIAGLILAVGGPGVLPAAQLADAPDATMNRMHPSWSPDGRWIAFVARPAEGREPGDLYLMRPDGSEYRRLSNTTLWEFQPDWSPDGRRLAFQVAGDPREQWRLGFVNADGTGRREVTVPEGSATVPSFSPDGDSLAVTVRTGGGSAIYVMALDGSGRRRVTSGEGEHSRPDWSPDGTKLLYDYRSGREAPWQLLVVNRDGSGRRQLTTEGGDDGSFSPDGSRIVFASDRNGERYEVWVMNADGTDQRSLTADLAGSASSGTFSPDGRQIAFSMVLEGQSSLYVMDADGANVRMLAATDARPGGNRLLVVTGPDTVSHLVRDTLELRVGETLEIVPAFSLAGEPLPPGDLWVHNVDYEWLEFAAPIGNGRYSANPMRVTGLRTGTARVMVHWSAGRANWVTFRVVEAADGGG